MSRPFVFLDALQDAHTLADLQRAIAAAPLDELDARKGRKVRDALSACAERIAGPKRAIRSFLEEALGARTVTEIAPLAEKFRVNVCSLLPEADAEADLDPDVEEAQPHTDLIGASPESGFLRGILDDADGDTDRLIYADWLDERGLRRGELIRVELELRKDRDPTRTPELTSLREEAKRDHALQTLTQFFPDPALWPEDWKKRDGRLTLVGQSFPEEAIAAFAERPIPEQVEILSSLLRLPEQWADYHRLFTKRRRRQNGEEFTLIACSNPDCPHQEGFFEHRPPAEAHPDGHHIWHPFPTYGDSGDPQVFSLLRHLHAPETDRTMLFQRSLQGLDCLNITANVPLPILAEALAADLRDNAPRIPGGLDTDEPVWMWSQYDPDNENYDPADALVYHPAQFTDQHGGEELTGGYDITLTDDRRLLPREGEEPITAGYRSLGCNLSPADYLDVLQGRSNDRIRARTLDLAQYRSLCGWTPQMYYVADMASLDRFGQPLDQDGDSYRVRFLLGGFFRSSRRVAYGDWGPIHRRADLHRRDPDYRHADYGAPVAVLVKNV